MIKLCMDLLLSYALLMLSGPNGTARPSNATNCSRCQCRRHNRRKLCVSCRTSRDRRRLRHCLRFGGIAKQIQVRALAVDRHKPVVAVRRYDNITVANMAGSAAVAVRTDLERLLAATAAARSLNGRQRHVEDLTIAGRSDGPRGLHLRLRLPLMVMMWRMTVVATRLEFWIVEHYARPRMVELIFDGRCCCW